MAVPTHFRFTARGEFTGSPEQWSFGFHMTRTNPGGGDAGTSEINQGQVTTAFTALLANNTVGSNVKMLDWRAYQIGTNGKVEPTSDIVRVDTSAAGIVGTGNVRYPNQIALAMTFVADDRGPARLGRFYLPGPNETLAADGRLSTAQADARNLLVTDFLKAVANSIDLDLTLQAAGCNVSSRGGGGAGTLQEIDHVECGRVLDTLRSRRTSLLEERQVGGQIDW